MMIIISPIIKAKWILVCILAIALLQGCSSSSPKEENKKPEYKLEVYKCQDGWAYNLLFDEKIIVKQEFIPVIQKRIPFQSKEDATNAGNLLIYKLEHNQKPTVTFQELDSLKISM